MKHIVIDNQELKIGYTPNLILKVGINNANPQWPMDVYTNKQVAWLDSSGGFHLNPEVDNKDILSALEIVMRELFNAVKPPTPTP